MSMKMGYSVSCSFLNRIDGTTQGGGNKKHPPVMRGCSDYAFFSFGTRDATKRFPKDRNAAKKNTHWGPKLTQMNPLICAAMMDTKWSRLIPVERALVTSSGDNAMLRRYTDLMIPTCMDKRSKTKRM